MTAETLIENIGKEDPITTMDAMKMENNKARVGAMVSEIKSNHATIYSASSPNPKVEKFCRAVGCTC